MIDQKLKDYVKNKRAAGVSDYDIRQKLMGVGWLEADINQALWEEDDIPMPPASDVPVPSTPSVQPINTPPVYTPKGNLWDAFEHIIMFISLYIAATSLALILHYMVRKYIPETTLSSYYNSYSYSSSYSWEDALVTGYASALIVSFPIFFFLFRRITNRTLKNPALRRERSRKILTYLTLIGTFIILVSQAISTVYTLLNGNITFNFFAHFFITCAITGGIFAYYFNEVKEDRKTLNV